MAVKIGGQSRAPTWSFGDESESNRSSGPRLSPTVLRQPRRGLQHVQHPTPPDLPTKSADLTRPG
jgi:hypothetical protein